MAADKMRDRTGPRRALGALIGVALVLGVAGAVLPHDVFWHSDEGAKFLQLINLRLGPAGLDSAIHYPGRALDPALQFVPFHPKQHRVDGAGNIYLQWPIFLPLLTWPFYTVLGLAGLGVWPLAGALAACWLSYRLALAVGAPAGWAWLAIPLLGLGTPVGFYSWVFFEHTLAAALVAGAVLLFVRGLAASEWRRLAGAGLVLGAAIYLRSELYVLVPAAGLILLARGLATRRGPDARRVLGLAGAALAGLVIALLPLWGYYLLSEGTVLPQHATWYFDSPTPEGAAAPAGGLQLPELRYLAQAGLGLIPDFLTGPADAAGPTIKPWVSAALLLGILTALGLAIADCGLQIIRRARNRQPHRAEQAAANTQHATRNTQHATRNTFYVSRFTFYAFGLALLAAGCGAVLLDPATYTSLHGFVLAAPVGVAAAAAAWPGGAAATARRLLAALAGLYIGLHVLVISALSGLGPISRYEWGQRYLLPAYPLLIALALAGLARLWNEARSEDFAVRSTQYAFARRAIVALTVLLALIGAGFLARGWTVLRAGKADAQAWAAAVAAAPDPVLLTDRWWLPLVLAPQFDTHTWLLAATPATAVAWPAQAARAGLAGFSTVTFTPTLALPLPGATPGPAITRAGLTVQHFTLDDGR